MKSLYYTTDNGTNFYRVINPLFVTIILSLKLQASKESVPWCACVAESVEFREIPNFSRQAEQACKLTYMILYFHTKIQQCVFLILH